MYETIQPRLRGHSPLRIPDGTPGWESQVVVADVNRIHGREKDRAKDEMDDGLTVSILR